ncbi:MAG: hypothetical protein CM1200mP14_28260 [Gammaproteobacteria bacterium]|nr:MAG: hypothetical protein CM1200mP14_28260 [Gammaproteobacteria bacterium]
MADGPYERYQRMASCGLRGRIRVGSGMVPMRVPREWSVVGQGDV